MTIIKTIKKNINANLNNNASKKFTIKTSLTGWKTKPAPVWQYTNTCIKCKKTWHEDYSYIPLESKRDCCTINNNGYYRNRLGKIIHEKH